MFNIFNELYEIFFKWFVKTDKLKECCKTNINVNLTEKPMVSLAGKAHWVKVNTRYDEFEGKRKYKIALSFDKADEAKMK